MLRIVLAILVFLGAVAGCNLIHLHGVLPWVLGGVAATLALVGGKK